MTIVDVSRERSAYGQPDLRLATEKQSTENGLQENGQRPTRLTAYRRRERLVRAGRDEGPGGRETLPLACHVV